MPSIRIPAHDWRPRPHQRKAWTYLERGGRHAELVWHRRAGKDELALQHAVCSALQRPGNYWHMLPLAVQARKAIWTSVNPHSGRRRIDEVFPPVIRRATREHEMQIELANGSTWQVLGSDNFQSSIGSSPVGIVYSEWAQADPSARGFLRPILAENGGWQVFITTPRGKNHAHKTFKSAQQNPKAYAELLTAEQTNIFDSETLASELQAYIDDYGDEFGRALFEQEYLCSFNAAILGAYYGSEIARMEREGRIGVYPHDPKHPVYTAWDIGFSDDTAIWFYQLIGGRVRIIDYYYQSGVGMAHYAGQLIGREVELTINSYRVTAEYGADIPEAAHRKAYRYEKHHLPHDAKAKRIESAGKSIQDQLAAVVGANSINIVPMESLETGIQAVRALLPYVDMDEEQCSEGLEAVRSYQREWDDERKVFSNRPLHNWCFTGDTMILTRNGTHQIMDLPFSGEVLTLCGWKRYINPRITRKNAQLVEVEFSDGSTVRCTPDHLFMTVCGWKSASDLLPGTQIRSSLIHSRSISMAASIGYGLKKLISRAPENHYTERLGKRLSVRSLMAVISTTATAIRLTMPSRILNVFQPKSIWRRHGGKQKATLPNIFPRTLAAPLQHGTLQKLGSYGTSATQNVPSHGRNGSVSHVSVWRAAIRLIASFAPMAISKNSAATTAKLLTIANVRRLNEQADVWCLTVPGQEHFSLANGAIVHNCSHPADALRYLALAWQQERVPKQEPKPRIEPFTEQWLEYEEDDRPKTRYR